MIMDLREGVGGEERWLFSWRMNMFVYEVHLLSNLMELLEGVSLSHAGGGP